MSTHEYTEETDEYLTLDEAAALLKVHPATIRRRIKKGELPGAVMRPDKGVLGVRDRYFIPRNALQTPFEVRDVVPVEHGVSVDTFTAAIDIHLRTQMSKQRQDIIEAIEQTIEAHEQTIREQLKEQSQHEQERAQAIEQTFYERFEEQNEVIKELTAQVAALKKPRFLDRLRRKPTETPQQEQ